MWLKRDLNFPALTQPAGVTIGAFDGVHRGHQALIGALVNNSHAAGRAAIAVTFDPLPVQCFTQKEAVLLTSREERLRQLEILEVDGVVLLPFDHQMRQIPAETFVIHLRRQLQMTELWIGPDFKLGHDRRDTTFLQSLGRDLDFEVHILPPYQHHGIPVRSTRIRAALQNGLLTLANELLGRPYQLTGSIEHGEKRGRTLGFPTANLGTATTRLLPAHGCYICRAHLARGAFGAVTNIGTRPTFNHSQVTVEAHLLDFAADIYGETLQLDFMTRLRPELKFASAEALIKQLHQDKNTARAWLALQQTTAKSFV
ncbi:MAG: riboflavin biosynthesis protein RibF [Chloroflexota bacterium]|nr:riboflavin biosynthesis protein RibF [Chloroflexota bacterium]